jgi:hypothetical protein
MYVLEHLKELDRSTGRRYRWSCAGQCTLCGVAALCLYGYSISISTHQITHEQVRLGQLIVPHHRVTPHGYLVAAAVPVINNPPILHRTSAVVRPG